MKKIISIVFICFALIGSAAAQTEPKMPDMWLGNWLNEQGRARLTVNPDGTMINRMIETGEIDRFAYKVVNIEDDFVTFLTKEEDGDVFVSAFFISSPIKGLAFLGPNYRWGEICGVATEQEWQNPMAYKQQLIARIDPNLRDTMTNTGTISRPVNTTAPAKP